MTNISNIDLSPQIQSQCITSHVSAWPSNSHSRALYNLHIDMQKHILTLTYKILLPTSILIVSLKLLLTNNNIILEYMWINMYMNLLPHFVPDLIFFPQKRATYTTFSMSIISSTSFVTKAHTHRTSTAFTALQQDGNGLSFGPDFLT